MIKLVAAILLLVTFPSVALAQPQAALSTPEDFKHEFGTVPCNNPDRRDAVTGLFKRMGAAAADIAHEKYKGVENVEISKQGTSAEVIIVGAHSTK